jgi:DHA2 family multidrug resistance protein
MSSYLTDRGLADPDKAALAQLNGIVTREATVLTFNDCFLVMSLLFGLMLVLIPLIRRPKPAAAPAEAH